MGQPAARERRKAAPKPAPVVHPAHEAGAQVTPDSATAAQPETPAPAAQPPAAAPDASGQGAGKAAPEQAAQNGTQGDSAAPGSPVEQTVPVVADTVPAVQAPERPAKAAESPAAATDGAAGGDGKGEQPETDTGEQDAAPADGGPQDVPAPAPPTASAQVNSDAGVDPRVRALLTVLASDPSLTTNPAVVQGPEQAAVLVDALVADMSLVPEPAQAAVLLTALIAASKAEPTAAPAEAPAEPEAAVPQLRGLAAWRDEECSLPQWQRTQIYGEVRSMGTTWRAAMQKATERDLALQQKCLDAHKAGLPLGDIVRAAREFGFELPESLQLLVAQKPELYAV